MLNTNDGIEPTPVEAERAFSRLPPSLIHMSGGEPLLFPGFADLCRRLCRRHWISINTNLTVGGEVDKLVQHVPAARVSRIAAALHTEERQRNGLPLLEFARNVVVLQDAGFPVSALYVLHPTLLELAAIEIPQLRSLGVKRVDAKLFKGVYDKKRYPDAYSPRERDAIQHLKNDYRYVDAYLEQDLGSFKGTPCTAGRTSFKVSVNGDVRRCASVSTSYGNLYNGTFNPETADEECTARRVLVLSQCLRYSLINRGEAN